MSARILITGAAGFFGRHLHAWLQRYQPDAIVFGTDLHAPPDRGGWRTFFAADLTDAAAVERAVGECAPEVIFHLAGLFHTQPVAEIYRVNALGTVTLLDAVRAACPGTVIVAAGSAAEYGRPAAEALPIREDCPRRPVNLYGVSKGAATDAVVYYARQHGLSALVVRPFQLLGRGLTARLAPGAFAEQVRSAKQAERPVIEVGNLESARDFLDVGDACSALWALAQRPAPGEVFNLCSGVATRMRTLLEQMLAAASVEAEIRVDPSRLRGAAEVDAIYGDPGKLQRHTGWRAQTAPADSVREMVTDAS